MKIIKLYTLILLIFLLTASSAYSEDNNFTPWNSDVLTGDDRIQSKTYGKENIKKIFNAPKAGAFFMIRAFQIFISPQDGPNCRFHPTCSRYGKIAVLKYGAFLGALLAGDRIVRCNPFTPPGEDPVPDSIFH